MCICKLEDRFAKSEACANCHTESARTEQEWCHQLQGTAQKAEEEVRTVSDQASNYFCGSLEVLAANTADKAWKSSAGCYVWSVKGYEDSPGRNLQLIQRRIAD